MEDIILKMFNGVSVKLEVINVVTMFIVLIAVVAAYIALAILQKKIRSRPNIKDDLRKSHFIMIAFRIARVSVVVIGAIIILQSLGVNLTALSAVIGLIGIIFVLALKDALLDIFSGFMIVSDKFFSVGDAVEYNGRDGVVISLSARSTKIELLDDRSVLSVANRNISQIRRLTHLVDIDLHLPYELSQKDAYEVLSVICNSIREIDGVESCELKGTQDFGASAIIYKIRFFCDPKDRPDIRRAVIKTIQDGLERADIHIPYQQIDIHEK